MGNGAKYKRLRTLGKGTFGKAFLCQGLSRTHPLVVVKQLGTGSCENSSENMKEAAILSRLRHKNIIRFLELFKTPSGRTCITMEYASGGDLSKLLKARSLGESSVSNVISLRTRDHYIAETPRYLLESDVLYLWLQVGSALEYLEQNSVLHRDLKTANIFLTDKLICKVGDFGMSRRLNGPLDLAKTLVGTPYYLSPELIQEIPYRHESDVWCWGVILCELTSFKRPFLGTCISDLAKKILTTQPITPDPKLYSEALINLILEVLEKDYRDRPSASMINNRPWISNLQKLFNKYENYETLLPELIELENKTWRPWEKDCQESRNISSRSSSRLISKISLRPNSAKKKNNLGDNDISQRKIKTTCTTYDSDLALTKNTLESDQYSTVMSPILGRQVRATSDKQDRLYGTDLNHSGSISQDNISERKKNKNIYQHSANRKFSHSRARSEEFVRTQDIIQSRYETTNHVRARSQDNNMSDSDRPRLSTARKLKNLLLKDTNKSSKSRTNSTIDGNSYNSPFIEQNTSTMTLSKNFEPSRNKTPNKISSFFNKQTSKHIVHSSKNNVLTHDILTESIHTDIKSELLRYFPTEKDLFTAYLELQQVVSERLLKDTLSCENRKETDTLVHMLRMVQSGLNNVKHSSVAQCVTHN